MWSLDDIDAFRILSVIMGLVAIECLTACEYTLNIHWTLVNTEYRKTCCWIYQLLWYTITIFLCKRLSLTYHFQKQTAPAGAPAGAPAVPSRTKRVNYESHVLWTCCSRINSHQHVWVLIYLPGHMLKQFSMLCWMLIWSVFFFYRNHFDYFYIIL